MLQKLNNLGIKASILIDIPYYNLKNMCMFKEHENLNNFILQASAERLQNWIQINS